MENSLFEYLDQLTKPVDDLTADSAAIPLNIFADHGLHSVDMGTNNGEIPIVYRIAALHEFRQKVSDG